MEVRDFVRRIDRLCGRSEAPKMGGFARGEGLLSPLHRSQAVA